MRMQRVHNNAEREEIIGIWDCIGNERIALNDAIKLSKIACLHDLFVTRPTRTCR